MRFGVNPQDKLREWAGVAASKNKQNSAGLSVFIQGSWDTKLLSSALKILHAIIKKKGWGLSTLGAKLGSPLQLPWYLAWVLAWIRTEHLERMHTKYQTCMCTVYVVR